jgi:hypothetical protein
MTVRAVAQVQRYFQNQRALEDLDREDGLAMGYMLVDSLGVFKKGTPRGRGRTGMGRLALSVMMEKNVALKEIGKKWKWFAPMLTRMLENKPLPPASVSKRLTELDEKDGIKIGKVSGRERARKRRVCPVDRYPNERFLLSQWPPCCSPTAMRQSPSTSGF